MANGCSASLFNCAFCSPAARRLTHKTARTSVITLIQRFGSALNINIHFHMLFLDGVYVDGPDGSARFRWVKAPTSQELTQVAHTIARRVGCFLERQGLLEWDAENSYLAGDAVDHAPLNQLLGSSVTYRIVVGPQAGHKVFTLQTPTGLHSKAGGPAAQAPLQSDALPQCVCTQQQTPGVGDAGKTR